MELNGIYCCPNFVSSFSMNGDLQILTWSFTEFELFKVLVILLTLGKSKLILLV